MDIIIVPTLNVLYVVLSMASWIIVAHIIVSWLVMFGIINLSNRFVYSVVSFLSRFTEIFARPIRSFVPVIAGLDLPIFVVLLAIYFMQGVIARILMRYVFL